MVRCHRQWELLHSDRHVCWHRRLLGDHRHYYPSGPSSSSTADERRPGFGGGFLLGLPGGLFVAELVDGEASWWIYVTALAGGPLGAWGWLSLLTLFAGPAPTTGELRGVRWVLSAVGRRSMTAYLLQSVIFLGIFMAVEALEVPVSKTANVLFAWATWLLIAVVCAALEYAGKRGPFEVLIRTAVTSTATRPAPVLSTKLP